jgi:formamidopyrimidine-DNA glycosylase
VVITFSSGDRLFFNDLRIFGWIKIVQTAKVKDVIGHLGPELFKDLTQEIFKEILQSSKKPVKLVLMDQEKIAGVGNIYANEALFMAGIHPKTPANKISEEETELLYHKLLKSLKDGIKWGGASENNFRDAYGRMGRKQEHFLVYGREGEKCLNGCGGIIRRMILAGRGTFYCPKCQKD